MATVAEARAAKRNHGASLMSLPNVVSLGVGPKVSDGHDTGVIALKVFVSRKVPPGSLGPGEAVPPACDGVPTDVEVLAPLRASGRE